MVTIKAHFDGKMIVPDDPVHLPTGRQFTFHVDPFESPMPNPVGVPGKSLLRFAGSIPPDEIDIIANAIHQGCERTDADEW